MKNQNKNRNQKDEKIKKRGFAKRFGVLTLSCVLLFVTLAFNAAPTLADEGLPILVNYPAGEAKKIEDVVFETKEFQSFYDSAYSSYENFPRTRHPEDAATATSSAYTSGTSAHYNGTATPDHIVFDDDEMRFFGYASTPYFDWVFSESYAVNSVEFDFYPGQWNFHCFKRTGFFVRAKRNGDGTISGYLFSVGSTISSTPAQNSSFRQIDDTPLETGRIYDMSTEVEGDLSYDLFYVENMDINAYNAFVKKWSNVEETYVTPEGTMILNKGQILDDNKNPLYTPNRFLEGATDPTDPSKFAQGQGRVGEWFSLGESGSSQTILRNGSYQGSNEEYLDYYFDGEYALPKGTAVTKLATNLDPALGLLTSSSTKTHFRVTVSNASFQIYVTLNAESTASPELLLFNQATTTSNQGFGFYMQNMSHCCQMLTHITYAGVTMTDSSGLNQTTATVKFRQLNKSEEIKGDETLNGFVGTEYAINPPPTITYNGKTYYYYKHSRSISGYASGFGPLDPLKYAANPNNNETTLYYVLAPTATKRAQIVTPSGAFNNGTEEAPVATKYGDIIEYSVIINNPNASQIDGFGAIVTDLLPEGIEFVSAAAVTTGPNQHPAGTRTTDSETGRDLVTWNITTLHIDTTTLTVRCKVTKPVALFKNTATVQLRDGLGAIEELDPIETNTTYHEATLKPITIQKDATVQSSGIANNGTATAPVKVIYEDVITYAIT
ncbi:MAG: DUF11 domain-containing protein, partial [Oscillospiraceae bacterium]|nr:DUF11 domain-containing protein [Oscillospiraceae bacterium]